MRRLAECERPPPKPRTTGPLLYRRARRADDDPVSYFGTTARAWAAHTIYVAPGDLGTWFWLIVNASEKPSPKRGDSWGRLRSSGTGCAAPRRRANGRVMSKFRLKRQRQRFEQTRMTRWAREKA